MVHLARISKLERDAAIGVYLKNRSVLNGRKLEMHKRNPRGCFFCPNPHSHIAVWTENDGVFKQSEALACKECDADIKYKLNMEGKLLPRLVNFNNDGAIDYSEASLRYEHLEDDETHLKGLCYFCDILTGKMTTFVVPRTHLSNMFTGGRLNVCENCKGGMNSAKFLATIVKTNCRDCKKDYLIDKHERDNIAGGEFSLEDYRCPECVHNSVRTADVSCQHFYVPEPGQERYHPKNCKRCSTHFEVDFCLSQLTLMQSYAIIKQNSVDIICSDCGLYKDFTLSRTFDKGDYVREIRVFRKGDVFITTIKEKGSTKMVESKRLIDAIAHGTE